MNEIKEWETALANQLKSIARRPDIKSYLEEDPVLYPLLKRAAARFVTGDTREEGLRTADELQAQGYRASLEYIGENTTSEAECEQATEQLAELIRGLSQRGTRSRVSFDLSHIGLSLSEELAFANLISLAEEAERGGVELFISMEESAKTNAILRVYERAAASYRNVGLTLQAHLHRTKEDLAERLPANSLLRIVKGAYQEPEDVALPRSADLDGRFLELVETAIRKGHRVSFATHDERLVDAAIERDWARGEGFEFEMLYGIRPDLSIRLKEAGYAIRIYLTYGREWYLYLCHRIAEYPPNIFRAVTAIIGGEDLRPRYRM